MVYLSYALYNGSLKSNSFPSATVIYSSCRSTSKKSHTRHFLEVIIQKNKLFFGNTLNLHYLCGNF